MIKPRALRPGDRIAAISLSSGWPNVFPGAYRDGKRQLEEALSTDQQIRKCREYADTHGMQVLDEHIYADEAISGDTDNRAALQQFLAAARQKRRHFDVLLVDDTSRLSRRLVDSLQINEQLQFVGVRVIYIAQGFDTSSEQAELLVATHGIIDSLYLKDLAKRTFRGVE